VIKSINKIIPVVFFLFSCNENNSTNANKEFVSIAYDSSLAIFYKKEKFCLEDSDLHSSLDMEQIDSISKNVLCRLSDIGYFVDSISLYQGNIKTHTLFLLKGFTQSNFQLCNTVDKIINFNITKGNTKVLIQGWTFRTETEAKDCYENNLQLFIRDKFPYSRAQRIENMVFYIESGKQEKNKVLFEVDSLISL